MNRIETAKERSLSDFSQNFEESIEPSYLVPLLSRIARQTIIREKTLVIFDEVQLCERALTSLKYFCEHALITYIMAYAVCAVKNHTVSYANIILFST